MRRAILFRFHNYLYTCRNHLQLLAALNPGVPIFGLFGGPEWLCPPLKAARRLLLGPALTHLSCISGQSKRWKWANSDLVVRMWYRDVGRHYPFDVLHVIEWDLALFVPLAEAYAGVPADRVGLTGLTPLGAVADRWSWMTDEPHRAEWLQLLQFARTHFAHDATQYVCIGPGMCLPRAFLDRYLDVEFPALGHDELRLPLVAQSLDFGLHDTGFYRRWFDPEEMRYFNAETAAIDPVLMREELARPEGRRVFHPVRGPVSASWVRRRTGSGR